MLCLNWCTSVPPKLWNLFPQSISPRLKVQYPHIKISSGPFPQRKSQLRGEIEMEANGRLFLGPGNRLGEIKQKLGILDTGEMNFYTGKMD